MGISLQPQLCSKFVSLCAYYEINFLYFLEIVSKRVLFSLITTFQNKFLMGILIKSQKTIENIYRGVSK